MKTIGFRRQLALPPHKTGDLPHPKPMRESCVGKEVTHGGKRSLPPRVEEEQPPTPLRAHLSRSAGARL